MRRALLIVPLALLALAAPVAAKYVAPGRNGRAAKKLDLKVKVEKS